MNDEDISASSPAVSRFRKISSPTPNINYDGANDTVRVPVNEDYLFDVDVEKRELAPAYWLGPVYNVRRGSWFYPEGSNLRPCEENLADQLEEGYLRVRPWRTSYQENHSIEADAEADKSKDDSTITSEKLEVSGEQEASSKNDQTTPAKFELQTQRLFGAYLNSVVTFVDSETAWILSDDLLSRMSSTVYQRFAGGGHLGGTKVVRGYREPSKQKDQEKEVNKSSEQTEPTTSPTAAQKDVNSKNGEDAEHRSEAVTGDSEPRLLKLERQMSSLVASTPGDQATREAEARQRDEDEIKDDYVHADGEEQGREIEHLVLVVSLTFRRLSGLG